MIEWLEEQIAEYMDRYVNAKANHNHKQMEIEWARVEAYQRCLDHLNCEIKDGKIEL